MSRQATISLETKNSSTAILNEFSNLDNFFVWEPLHWDLDKKIKPNKLLDSKDKEAKKNVVIPLVNLYDDIPHLL